MARSPMIPGSPWNGKNPNKGVVGKYDAEFQNDESLTRVKKERYLPISSQYLMNGFKQEQFEMTRLPMGPKRLLASVKVHNFFMPMPDDDD